MNGININQHGMVDEVRTLLVNPPTGDGYLHVDDGPADTAVTLFGLGGTSLDAQLVDRLLSLALAPDLVWARDVFDPRVTPEADQSIYRSTYEVSDLSGQTLSLSLDGLYDRVLGSEGRWRIAALFTHPDKDVGERLTALRDAAFGKDAAYALGAVLLACAYRRKLLQGND